MLNVRRRIHGLTVTTLVLIIFVLVCSTALGRERADKFLVLHLDAVSSADFFAELEAGGLPNIAELFQNGQKVKHGLTLYPGGTEIIMPRIKEGLDNSQGNSVGWGYLDRETGAEIGDVPIFLEMFSGFSRRNRHQFVTGIPVFHHLAGLSMLNIERIWETQDVVEFFWFHSDVMGHLSGREAHLKSIRTFDRYLGLAAQRGKLDGANLVLYTDHGMTTEGVETVRHETIITQIVQDELRYLAYPNIYLHDPGQKDHLAQEIAEQTAIDIALIKVSDEVVRGYTAHGHFEIAHKNGRFAYRFVGEDYFGYADLGCADTFLSKDEWLRQTKEHIYPAAPPNLFSYLSNPRVGDIVTILNPPKIPFALRAQLGNHAGLKASDLTVPLLVTGPAFEDLASIEEFWLHELYSVHLPMIDFRAKASRERHMINLSYPASVELTLSPAYRWRAGLAISEQGTKPWLEYDLYSSFLTRIWVGALFDDHRLNWQMRVEGFVGDVGVSWLKRGDQEGQFRFHWRFVEQAEITVSKEMVGVSLVF